MEALDKKKKNNVKIQKAKFWVLLIGSLFVMGLLSSCAGHFLHGGHHIQSDNLQNRRVMGPY